MKKTILNKISKNFNKLPLYVYYLTVKKTNKSNVSHEILVNKTNTRYKSSQFFLSSPNKPISNYENIF